MKATEHQDASLRGTTRILHQRTECPIRTCILETQRIVGVAPLSELWPSCMPSVLAPLVSFGESVVCGKTSVVLMVMVRAVCSVSMSTAVPSCACRVIRHAMGCMSTMGTVFRIQMYADSHTANTRSTKASADTCSVWHQDVSADVFGACMAQRRMAQRRSTYGTKTSADTFARKVTILHLQPHALRPCHHRAST